MSICSVIQKRKSCRAYTGQSVDVEIIRSLLEMAKWAPSGVNHQPTKVAILGTETRRKLSQLLVENFDAGVVPNPDYVFCPDSWSDVYKMRRKACGSALYESAPRTIAYTWGTFHRETFSPKLILTPGAQYVLFLTIDKDYDQCLNGYGLSWGAVEDTAYPCGTFVFLNDEGDSSQWTTTPWSTYGLDLVFRESQGLAK